MTTTTRMRTLLAGLTIAGALAVPLSGAASASNDGRSGSRGTETPREKAGSTTSTPERRDERAGRGSDDNRRNDLDARADVCRRSVDRRLADLAKLAAKAEASDTVTDAHAAAIAAIVADATTGLGALRAEIDTATTTAALAPLCERVVTDFRIYALRIPQVKLVLAADALAAKQPAFAALRTKLAESIATGATPENNQRLTELLATYDRAVADALAEAATVADPVLAITVADANADRKVLRPYAASMKDARRDAKTAANVAREILAVVAGEDHADDLPGHDRAKSEGAHLTGERHA